MCRYTSKNWLLDAWREINDWIKDDVLWVRVMGILDYSKLAVIGQRWGSSGGRWGWSVGFLAHELCEHVLFAMSAELSDLDADCMHPARMPNALAALNKLCTHGLKSPLAGCTGCEAKRDLRADFQNAAEVYTVETRMWHTQALRWPLVLGLATYPYVGYVFVRELLRHADPGLHKKLSPAVPDRQLKATPAQIKAVRALFTVAYHEQWCAGFDEMIADQPRDHKWRRFSWAKHAYDPVKIIQAEWSRLRLGDRKYQGDWLRIGNKPDFDFRTQMRDGPLYDFFISVIFVLSIGNPVIEGMFNKYDLYGSPLLDFFRKEGWLIYLDMLVKDRAKRRAPEMRSKPSTSKAGKDLSKTELTKDAASCKQLEQYSRDFGSSIQGETTQDYNNGSVNWKAEIDKHKARRDAKVSWHDACMHCRDGGNCRHTGTELMMCETCSNVAHLGCTGLDSEPDLWHCGEGGCPAVE